MRIDHIVTDIVHQVAGRLLRRALLAAAIGIAVLAALYNGTVAGRLALQAEYGDVYAYLIVGGIYTALVLVGVIWWMLLGRAQKPATPIVGQPRQLQIAMLIEAAMLGYSLGNGRERAS